MELQVIGEKSTSVSVSDEIFGRSYSEPLVHQVVTTYMTSGRQGTKAQKTRSEVSGGGIKPWRQKGTGRARAGSIRSPLWRTGGTTFAAKPRDYTQKLNKKMYRNGMASILSELHRQNRLIIVDTFVLAQPKTKTFIEKMKAMSLGRALIIVKELEDNLILASRNVPNVAVICVHELDPVSLLAFDQVVVAVDALKEIEEKLS